MYRVPRDLRVRKIEGKSRKIGEWRLDPRQFFTFH